MLEATIAFFVLEGILSALLFILFIFRQLAPRPFRSRYSRNVTPEDEPLLWSFVNRIADTVNAPRPSQIEIDCDVNASAAKVLNARGVHTQQDALAIGLALAMGMTVEQLAGVIAHELGHFAQRKANGYLFWFDVFISEIFGYSDWRDRVDQKLVEFACHFNGRSNRMRSFFFSLVVLIYRSWYVMMWLPSLVHHHWRRQSEYDADQYEVRLVGSAVFEQARKQIASVACAWNKAFDDAKRFRHEGNLPDNFPMLLEATLKSIHPKEQKKAEKRLLEEKAKRDHAHPSPSDRIAVAKRMPMAGVYLCDLPASVLFQNQQDAFRDATLELYRQHFDESLSAADLHPAEAFIAERDKERMRKHTAREFGLGADPSNRAPPVVNQKLATSLPESVYLSTLVKELELARNTMQDSAASYESSFEKWQEANYEVWAGTTAELMMQEGVKRLADPLVEFNGKPQWAKERMKQGRVRAEQLSHSLLQFEAGSAQRWQKAVEILSHPVIQPRIPDAAKKLERARDMLCLLAALHSTRDQRVALFHFIGTTALFLDVKRDTSSTWQTIYERLESTASEYSATLGHFDGCDYPFPHSRSSLSVREYLTPFQDMTTIQMKVLDGAAEMLFASWELQWRAAEWMCELTLEVEAALGLPPLPLLATEKENGDDLSEAASQAA